jgi:hypothetical protein
MQSGLSLHMPFNTFHLHEFKCHLQIPNINNFSYFQILAGKNLEIANDLFFNQILNTHLEKLSLVLGLWIEFL